MVTALEICQFLEEFAPLSHAESWDNVGMLFGRSSRTVTRLMTCLTLTEDVAEEAIRRDIQMIVTHHPILFRGTKQITDHTSEGRLLLALAENGIVVHSPHTAFDSAAAGINQQLAEAIGLTDVKPLKVFANNPETGAGRFGALQTPVARDDFLSLIVSVTGASHLEYSWTTGRPASKVAVACGAAGDFLNNAFAANCDTFITGETRFHTILEAQTLGTNIILVGHFHSERPAIERLATIIENQFAGITCFASEKDQNPLTLFQKGL